jgi:hypothetical protein
MQIRSSSFQIFAALLLALCVGSGLQGQSVLDVQATVNGILTGADATTHPHLDHNQDGLVNVVDVQHLVGEILNPPPPALTFGMSPMTIPVNQFWGIALGASGGAGAPYTFTMIGGSLPPGMIGGQIVMYQPPLPDMHAFHIHGTPTVVGFYSAIIELRDSAGNTVVRTIDITVVP